MWYIKIFQPNNAISYHIKSNVVSTQFHLGQLL